MFDDVFFFFKQKTAYEMRISDWSSDVCSSDLITMIPETLTASLYYSLNHRLGDGDTPDSSSVNGEIVWTLRPPEMNKLGIALAFTGFVQETNDDFDNPENDLQYQARSEERRVGNA